MSGPTETNANKSAVANSLLSAAAAHSLMDEDNLLLLQDVSLQDEPEAPDTLTTGAFSNVESSNSPFELDTFVLPPPPGGGLTVGTAMAPALASGVLEFQGRPAQFQPDILGPPSIATANRPLDLLESTVPAPTDVQPGPSVFRSSSSGQETSFASALFQTLGSEKHDPFQVSIRPPPSLTKVDTPHSFAPPGIAGPTTSGITSAPSSSYSGIPKFPNPDLGASTSISTPYSNFGHNTNEAPKSDKTLAHTASVALFTPAAHLTHIPDFPKSASSPSLLHDARSANTFVSPSAHGHPPLSAVPPQPLGVPGSTYSQYAQHGATERPAVPLFTPSSTFSTQPPMPPPAVPSTTAASFSPNPGILPNSSWDGYTVLPPAGSSQTDGSNKFRMTTQKPTYAQYPGINTPGTSSQPPLDFTQPLAKLTDPYHSLVSSSLYPTLPVEDSPQYDPSDGFGGPTVPKREIYPYYPPQYYWWYNREVDGRNFWKPFSIVDSTAIEEAFNSGSKAVVSTDGGRYDVSIAERAKAPVYWEEPHKINVRRCSWYYKGPLDSRFVPYDEEFSKLLETEFNQTCLNGYWHRRMDLGAGETVVMHSPTAVVHFCQAASPDEWGNIPENQLRPRVVKRGVSEFELEEGESDQIDHLVLIVHGIGSICDFKFRNPVEAVDEFRSVSQQLFQIHFKDAIGSNRAGRIEFLPIQWHAALHGEGGADDKLRAITLNSIPKLRSFTNDTLLDILFYTSPVYTQTVVNAVSSEINRIYNLFKSRHANFNGMVALGGHSLGSLIIFDILMNQPSTLPDKFSSTPATESEIKEDENDNVIGPDGIPVKRTRSRTVTYAVGKGGTGIQVISYPILHFHPTAFFAMGSPIAVFVTVRGMDELGKEFHFPTVPSFFNIFHPFDPVAYRIEPLIDPSLDLRPVLIPHHKGRKRFHLELKETMARVGTDIKNRVIESLKTTWNAVSTYTSFSKAETINEDIDRAIEGELESELKEMSSNNSPPENEETVRVGKLNGGNRIDFVLQEAPMETLNEYLFALASHVCYWSSEDTVLLLLKELYKKVGVHADASSTSLATGAPPPKSAPAIPIYNPAEYIPPEEPAAWSTNYVAPSAPPLYAQGETSQSAAQPPTFYNLNSTPAPSQSKTSGKTKLSARPLISADQFPIQAGMDPTAPISSKPAMPPPPLKGFVGSQKH